MLFSLTQAPNPGFNRTLWKDDWHALNPAEQERAALNASVRAKNAEIERDGMADMGISVAGDVTATIVTAILAGRLRAKRDFLQGDAEYGDVFGKGEGLQKDPSILFGLAFLPKTLLVPVGLAALSLVKWDGQRYLKEAGIVSLMIVIADMVQANVYKRRYNKLATAAAEGE